MLATSYKSDTERSSVPKLCVRLFVRLTILNLCGVKVNAAIEFHLSIAGFRSAVQVSMF